MEEGETVLRGIVGCLATEIVLEQGFKRINGNLLEKWERAFQSDGTVCAKEQGHVEVWDTQGSMGSLGLVRGEVRDEPGEKEVKKQCCAGKQALFQKQNKKQQQKTKQTPNQNQNQNHKGKNNNPDM